MEGSTCRFRVQFKVYHDTVLGLDFRGNVRYKDLKNVITEDVRLGSFAPLKDSHTVEFGENIMPKGFIARTNYAGTGQFVDCEKRIHM